jgi:23S rRNA pseudouridine2605 synthase
MARAGVASRRDSEAIILEGRVSVNGTIIDSPALDVTPRDIILVDGEALPSKERTRLWLYHKPKGLVTTNRDPEGRTTVFETLPDELPRVMSVGRLDINTEGLLLLTNDGGLARVLGHPATGWLRRYRVRAFGEVDQAQLDTLRKGITLDGEDFGPIHATFEREQGSNTWLTVDLREGKNREVKRVLEHLGLQVNRLIRVSFGPFQLAELAEGEVSEIRTRILKDQLGPELANEAGVDFDAPSIDRSRQRPELEERYERPQRSARSQDDRPPRRDERPARGGDRFERPDRNARGREEFENRPRTPRDVAEETPREDRKPDRFAQKKLVWRDVDASATEAPRGKPIPRRGADPRAERTERAEAGAFTRKRAPAVEDVQGRKVRVERVTKATPPSADAPLKRPLKRDIEAAREREESGVQDRRTARTTAYRTNASTDRSFGNRAPAGDRNYRPRDDGDRRPSSYRESGRDGDRPSRGPRPDRGDAPPGRDGAPSAPRWRDRVEGRDRPPAYREQRDGGQDRPPRSRDGESGERPRSTGRPSGPGRSFGDKPRTGGFGGKPGGRFGDKPGPRGDGPSRGGPPRGGSSGGGSSGGRPPRKPRD